MSAIDRNWWKDADEAVTIEQRTQQSLERNLLQRREESLKKFAEERKKRKELKQKIIRIEKMYALSHWAEQLGFSERTLRDWVKEGLLQAQYIRGTYRVSENSVLDFLKKEDLKRA